MDSALKIYASTCRVIRLSAKIVNIYILFPWPRWINTDGVRVCSCDYAGRSASTLKIEYSGYFKCKYAMRCINKQVHAVVVNGLRKEELSLEQGVLSSCLPFPVRASMMQGLKTNRRCRCRSCRFSSNYWVQPWLVQFFTLQFIHLS